jgi:Carboxypeptidase regulatory-like domain/Tetratricopeptide repeat
MRLRIGIVFVGAFTLIVSAAIAQTAGARVSGKIIDANGQPAAGLQAIYTNTTTQRVYKTKTDKNGAFDMVGVTVGDYQVTVISATGEEFYSKKTVVTAAGPNAVTIDLHGEAGASKPADGVGSKLTPEQIQELKRQNEQAHAANALITQAAVAALEQLIAMDPARYEFYLSLGEAQLNLGQCEKAVQTFQQGIEKAQSSTAVDPKNPATDPAKKTARIASMLTNQGNCYLKLKKNDQAIAAYEKAAALDSNPGTAYFNLCATHYNTGNIEGALKACDKAIAAQPNRADAYFIKGSLLIAESKTDKSGKVILPPGTVEALNKYLELAPDGPRASDVKQMLSLVGAKVETTYSKEKTH